jgi:large subunit ribosomal protein L29
MSWVVRPVNPKDVRSCSDEELRKKLAALKEELFNLRFQQATGQLENPIRLRSIRRTIARVKTVQHERELAVARPMSR